MATKKTRQTIQLSILERIIIPAILSNEGSYEQRIITRDLKNKVSLTQDEIKKFEVKTVGEGLEARLQWNSKGILHKVDMQFTTLEETEIRLALEKLEKDKKLTDDLIRLYEIFVLKK